MHVAAGTGRVVAGRYYLQDQIGRGAMGTVWRARDALLARDVAVKEVLLRGAGTPEETRVRYERTLREARTAARLNHPAVVTIFDVVEADGRPWIVMEFVRARSLEQILAQDGPLPPHKAADVGKRLLGALATAHAAGVLHRDVKPSNVLLGADDRAVLTDFGIATLEGDPGLTQAGMVMGTPGFTAPERIRGEPATPASDLWSLGATLYAAVEGHGPFDQCGSSLAVLSSIANEDAPQPRSAGALGPAIRALLRRDPSGRPDASAAGRLLAVAATQAATDRSPGGGYQDDPFQGEPLRTSPFQAEPLRTRPFQAGPFQGDPFQPDPSRRAGFRVDGYQGGVSRSGGYQSAGGPSGAPPVSSTFLPEGSSPGTRPTVPQPPAAELPAWMSFPPVGSPPEGVELPGVTAGPAPMDLSAGAALPPPVDRPRAIGLPARAEAPGRHGTRTAGQRRWLLAGLGAVAIACAGVIGGLAIGHSARSSVPAGYHWYRSAAAGTGTGTGTAASFSMAVPNGWHASTHGLVTDVVDPVGHLSMQVDLTPFEAATAPGQASLLEEKARTDDSLPGYRRVALRSFLFRGGLGAAWEFTWQQPGIGRTDVLDVLFKERTQAGRQACTLEVSGPTADRITSRAIFAEALRTFEPR